MLRNGDEMDTKFWGKKVKIVFGSYFPLLSM